jgi:acyl carrier protein
VVIAGEKKSGEKYLYAYFTARKELEVPEVREYLARQLPAHMIPSYFTQLEEMPLTPNGKIDRKRLSTISPGINTGKVYVAPKSDKEKMISAVWKEILELDRVGVDDNFFDLGGNSLDTIKVSQRLKEEFAGDIPMIIIFRYPTIRSIAAYLDREEDDFSAKKKEMFKAMDKGKNKRKKTIEKRKGRGAVNV